MHTTGRSSWVWALGVGAAVVWAALLLALVPWPDPQLALPRAIVVVVALSGAVAGCRAAVCPPGATRFGVAVLGGAASAYALLLGVLNAFSADHSLLGTPLWGVLWGVVVAAAMTGHVLPLLMVQVVPLLGARELTGAPTKRWIGVIIGCALATPAARGAGMVSAGVGNAMGILAVAAAVFGVVAAPVLTWLTVPRVTGEARRRTVLVAIASVVSPLILTICAVLGMTEQSQRLGEESSLGALFVGFSLAVASTAWFVTGALSPVRAKRDSVVLNVRVLGVLLTAAFAALGVLLVLLAAFVNSQSGLGALSTAIVVSVLGLLVGAAVSGVHRRAKRFIDPVAELRAELDAIPLDGAGRLRAEEALRRLTGDPALLLVIGEGGEPASSGPEMVGVAAGERTPSSQPPIPLAHTTLGGGRVAVATALPTTSAATRRLRRLGDLSQVLGGVVLEAEVARAASVERARLSRDLHDGLQSRLLGIALNLHLEGRLIDDPTTRGLLDETVGALRSAAEEARLLADGRVPDILHREGLRAAVVHLVGSSHPFVRVDIPPQRYAPRAEETGYFIVGEAISNAIKHGRASRVRVDAHTEGTVLTLTIHDDGVGGADPRAGSGLRRLAERVAASGGLLTVRDAAPHGTIIEASLPCG